MKTEFALNTLKFDYFKKLIHPRLKSHIFDKRGFTIKIPALSRLKDLFVSRGGTYMMVEIYHRNIHIADIGIRLIHNDKSRISMKSIFIQPVGITRNLLGEIVVSKFTKRIKLIYRVDSNPLRKIYLRPQSTTKIVQSLINECRGWVNTCSDFLKEPQ